MTVEESLQSLGLTEKQAKVYMAILEGGIVPASFIATRTNLKRPTVYVVLEELQSKALVHLIPKSKKKLFRALSPELLINRVKAEIQSVENRLPEIVAKMKKVGGEPRVLYYEGVEGVKEAVRYGRDRMKNKTYKGFYATASKEIQKKFNFFRKENEYQKNQGTKTLGMVPDSPDLMRYREEDKEFGRAMRVIPKDRYSSTVSVEIGADFVRFADYEHLQALIIDNPNIAKTMTEIFDMAWGSVKDPS